MSAADCWARTDPTHHFLDFFYNLKCFLLGCLSQVDEVLVENLDDYHYEEYEDEVPTVATNENSTSLDSGK